MFDTSTLLLLATLVAPHDSAARVASANDSVLASVVSPLVNRGDLVRVNTGFGVAKGALGTVDPLGIHLYHDPVDIWDQPRAEALTWSQIQRIDVHTKHAGNAARIGATIGGLLGLAMAASFVAYAAEDNSSLGAGGILIAYAGGGILGACTGAFAGGILGSFMPSWKTVYERR